MAGIKVDPPPVNMQIIDMKTGRPTRPFIEFLHRIWKRTGGEQDAIGDLESTNAYPFFRPAGPVDPEDRQPSFIVQPQSNSQAHVDEAMDKLAALVIAKAPEHDVIEAIESLRAVTLSDMAGLRSEVGELREQVESIFPLVAQIYKYLR
jgi:hypothetical protein